MSIMDKIEDGYERKITELWLRIERTEKDLHEARMAMEGEREKVETTLNGTLLYELASKLDQLNALRFQEEMADHPDYAVIRRLGDDITNLHTLIVCEVARAWQEEEGKKKTIEDCNS